MAAYSGSGSIAPRIIDLGTRWRWLEIIFPWDKIEVDKMGTTCSTHGIEEKCIIQHFGYKILGEEIISKT
jgi:hypothetical protein